MRDMLVLRRPERCWALAAVAGAALALCLAVPVWSAGRMWTVAGCALFVALAAGVSAWVERAANRRRELARDRDALALLNTELKAAHARVRTQNADLEATFAAMSDGVSYYDRDFRLVRSNHRVPALTGTPPEVMRVGVGREEVLRAQLRAGEFGTFPDEAAAEAEIRARMAAVAAHKPLQVMERTRPNGQTIELRRTSLADGGFVTIYTDVTARKQAASAQEAARRAAEQLAADKARFSAIVSHEVRTPLNVILNALGLVDRSSLPDGQRALVETGLQAGEALLALLNDILDLSRLEAGSLKVVPVPFAVAPLVAGVADMYRPLAGHRGVSMDVSVAGNVPSQVVADAGRVRQVLINLVSNAAKFSAPGEVSLRVEAVDGRMLRFAVRDSGPVIPAEARDRLFQPFAQLDAAADGGGSGLGLAICALLARRMGGEASLQEVRGPGGTAGNEFAVTVAMGTAMDEAPGLAAADGPGLPVPRTRILLVEDQAASRRLLAMALRREGHHVETASSGAEALTRAAEAPFDVVLMDVSMPDMDGMAATRRLRSLDAPAATAPVVGVTADASDGAREACLAAGMTEVLAKPVSPARLREVLARQVWRVAPPGGAERPGPPVRDATRLAGVPDAAALLRACLRDLAAQQAELADAAAQHNRARLHATAHAMAGAAANHGFAALADALWEMMEEGVMEKVELPARVAEELDRAWDETARAFGPDLVGATGIEPVTLRV